MSLCSVTNALEIDWQRAVRRHHPTVHWAQTDPLIPADPVELRRRLADVFTPDGRDLLARIVGLATAGDEHGALAATLTVLGRQVRWKKSLSAPGVSTLHVEHDVLAAAVWEAIVTEKRPDRAWLYERLVQVAWRAARKPVLQSLRAWPLWGELLEKLTVKNCDIADEVASSVTIDELLDQLAADGRLTERGRAIIENLAAGGTGLRNDRTRSPRSAAKERQRVVSRLRDSKVRQLLAS